MPNPIKQAFDFRFDDTIRRQVADDEGTKNVDFMLSRGKRISPSQEGVEAGLKTTKKFITLSDDLVRPRSKMADDKPKAKASRVQMVLGGKAEQPETKAERKLNKVSLERTTNGHIKATHRYSDGEEIHALAPGDFLGHLGKAFNLSEPAKKEAPADRSLVREQHERLGLRKSTPQLKAYREKHGIKDRTPAEERLLKLDAPGQEGTLINTLLPGGSPSNPRSFRGTRRY